MLLKYCETRRKGAQHQPDRRTFGHYGQFYLQLMLGSLSPEAWLLTDGSNAACREATCIKFHTKECYCNQFLRVQVVFFPPPLRHSLNGVKLEHGNPVTFLRTGRPRSPLSLSVLSGRALGSLSTARELLPGQIMARRHQLDTGNGFSLAPSDSAALLLPSCLAGSCSQLPTHHHVL